VLLVVAALVLAAVAAFWPSMEAIAALWSHPERRTYQHGYLIAALALWLLFRSRGQLVAATSAPVPALLALAAAGSICWLVAYRAGLQAVHVLLWPVVLWAAMTGALGLRAGRILLAPVAFLYFALPVWDALIPLLQQGTVLANRLLGTVFGVPMLIEDTLVHIPEGSFEIAGGCSGLNYFIVGIAIAGLLGEINGDSARRRLLLLAISGALAIASNWLRVFIIIYAGHVTDMTHYLVRVDHYNFGWVLYAFVLGVFFLIVRRLPDSNPERAAPGNRSAAMSPRMPAALAALAGLALGWMVSVTADLGQARDNADNGQAGRRDIDDVRFGPWQPGPAMGDWVPVFPGADAESLVDFTREGERIGVYTATYLRQAQGRELIGHDSRVQGSGSGRLAMHNVRAIAGAIPMEAIEAEWRSASGSRALLWWTYRVGSSEFTSGLRAQLWYGLASLWSEPVSAVVAMRAECRPDCEQARSSLQEFAAEALPAMLTAASRTGVSLE
jgi:exosortase A